MLKQAVKTLKPTKAPAINMKIFSALLDRFCPKFPTPKKLKLEIHSSFLFIVKPHFILKKNSIEKTFV